MQPSNHLNQCWLFIDKGRLKVMLVCIISLTIILLRSLPHYLKGQWVNFGIFCTLLFKWTTYHSVVVFPSIRGRFLCQRGTLISRLSWDLPDKTRAVFTNTFVWKAAAALRWWLPGVVRKYGGFRNGDRKRELVYFLCMIEYYLLKQLLYNHGKFHDIWSLISAKKIVLALIIFVVFDIVLTVCLVYFMKCVVHCFNVIFLFVIYTSDSCNFIYLFIFFMMFIMVTALELGLSCEGLGYYWTKMKQNKARAVCLQHIIYFVADGTALFLTHWGRDKMAAHFADDTFKRIFLKENIRILKFRWSLFLRAQLTILHRWFIWWLGTDQATSHYLNQWWLVHWRIYASLGLLNELT